MDALYPLIFDKSIDVRVNIVMTNCLNKERFVIDKVPEISVREPKDE